VHLLFVHQIFNVCSNIFGGLEKIKNKKNFERV